MHLTLDVFVLGQVILKRMWAFQYARNPKYLYVIKAD